MARFPVDKEARMRGYLVKKGDRFYAVVYEGTDPLTREERRCWTARDDRPAGRAPTWDRFVGGRLEWPRAHVRC